ncbi:predicted protein [Histoplasma capsulatum H143]|uniref:Uncharacterized protein n=1 Tax=Ajellomyces capsulatus (strain H143) TaxID=544712 RepID=C6HIS0_AJECH|nr:predicted protein [Histoplasma capsulatum H143]
MAAGTAGTGGIDTVEAIRTKCYGSLDPQIPASSSRVNSFDLKYTSTKSSSAKSELLFIRMFDSDTRKRIMTLITGMMTGSSLCDSRDNSLSWFAEGGRTWYPLTREDVNANSQSSYRWAEQRPRFTPSAMGGVYATGCQGTREVGGRNGMGVGRRMKTVESALHDVTFL